MSEEPNEAKESPTADSDTNNTGTVSTDGKENQKQSNLPSLASTLKSDASKLFDDSDGNNENDSDIISASGTDKEKENIENEMESKEDNSRQLEAESSGDKGDSSYEKNKTELSEKETESENTKPIENNTNKLNTDNEKSQNEKNDNENSQIEEIKTDFSKEEKCEAEGDGKKESKTPDFVDVQNNENSLEENNEDEIKIGDSPDSPSMNVSGIIKEVFKKSELVVEEDSTAETEARDTETSQQNTSANEEEATTEYYTTTEGNTEATTEYYTETETAGGTTEATTYETTDGGNTGNLQISGAIETNVSENYEEDANGNDEDDVMITKVKSPNTRVPSLESIEPKFSDEELQTHFNKCVQKKVLPPLDIRPYVVDYGRKRSIAHLMAEEYDQAQAADDAVALMLTSLETDNKSNEAEIITGELKERLDTTTQHQKDVEDKYQQRIEKARAEADRRVKALEEQHQNERSQFEEKWQKPETLQKFTKPSTKLLQIRRMQKSHAIAHDFRNAKQLKLAADAIQRDESIEAGTRAADTMRIQYIQLLERQEKAMQCLQENEDRKIAQLEAQRDAEVAALENTKKQLATRVSAPKMPRRPTVLVPVVTTRDGRASSGLVSSRTRTQYAVYKKGTERTRLEVKPLDVKAIIRPLTPSPRKTRK